uniref:Uncharacterized protein n=1 Tax=Arundo donax TaxID=35708 RepID=A0A0A9B3G9_ARUDO
MSASVGRKEFLVLFVQKSQQPAKFQEINCGILACLGHM